MRLCCARPCLRAAELQRHNRFPGGFRTDGERAETRPVRYSLDDEADHPCVGIFNEVIDEIQHRQIGFIADRDEFRKSGTELAQPGCNGIEQRA